MKVNGGFYGMNASAKGLSIHRKKMNLIAENLANAESVRGKDGKPYQRKFLNVVEESTKANIAAAKSSANIKMNVTNENHITGAKLNIAQLNKANEISLNVVEDKTEGDWVHMPEHPNANEEGYVELSNVNVINEMIDMIAATRSYEANLTAFNASKQMAKDALEI